jgi:hypothetical protein
MQLNKTDRNDAEGLAQMLKKGRPHWGRLGDLRWLAPCARAMRSTSKARWSSSHHREARCGPEPLLSRYSKSICCIARYRFAYWFTSTAPAGRFGWRLRL